MGETESSRIVRAKEYARDFLLGHINHHRTVYESIKALWESQKRVVSRESEIAQLQRQLAAAQQRLAGENGEVRSAIVTAANVVYSFNHHNEEGIGEVIYMEGDLGAQPRADMQEIMEALKFIFVTDHVLVRDATQRRLTTFYLDLQREAQVREAQRIGQNVVVNRIDAEPRNP